MSGLIHFDVGLVGFSMCENFVHPTVSAFFVNMSINHE